MTLSRSHARQMPRNRVLGRLKAGEMNKTESAYAEHLKAAQIAGEVEAWWFEGIGLKVAPNCHYYPDFLVLLPDGRLEVHEVKARAAGVIVDDCQVDEIQMRREGVHRGGKVQVWVWRMSE